MNFVINIIQYAVAFLATLYLEEKAVVRTDARWVILVGLPLFIDQIGASCSSWYFLLVLAMNPSFGNTNSELKLIRFPASVDGNLDKVTENRRNKEKLLNGSRAVIIHTSYSVRAHSSPHLPCIYNRATQRMWPSSSTAT